MLGWDLWSWEDFTSTHLKLGYTDRSLIDSTRPFGRRTLSLENLTDADSDSLWRWISLAWQPAKAPLPEMLEFRAGEFLKRPVRLDGNGIQIGRNTQLYRVAWNEVVLLEIDKIRHDRPDFWQLKLKLPGAKLILRRSRHYGIESRNWSGAEPEAIAGLLLSHAPVEKQVVIATKDDPITQQELHARRALARKQMREIKHMCWFLGVPGTATLAWFAFEFDWKFVAILTFFSLQYIAVVWCLYRMHRDAARKLEMAPIAETTPTP